MRAAVRLPFFALLGLTLVALSACSSSKPAASSTPARPSSTATAPAPTRGDADVMRTPPSGPAGQQAPRGERRMDGQGGQGMTPAQRVNLRLNQLKEELALSEAQEGRLRALLIADAQNAPQMRREDMQNMDREQLQTMMQAMQQRRERLNTAIEAELSPDQVQLYRAFVQQERQRMMERGRQMMNGGGN